jgi:hypothetical protein
MYFLRIFYGRSLSIDRLIAVFFRYYHNIDPDLHGTLRAVDPLTGPMSLGVEREYEIWESIYMGQQRPTLQSMYNQNVFKKEPFVYPKKF